MTLSNNTLARSPAAMGETLSEKADRLALDFATRADRHDVEGSFVAENYACLKDAGLIEAGVPAAPILDYAQAVESEQAVARDVVKHMVEEANARRHFGDTRAVDLQADGNVRLLRFAAYLRGTLTAAGGHA